MQKQDKQTKDIQLERRLMHTLRAAEQFMF